LLATISRALINRLMVFVEHFKYSAESAMVNKPSLL
jgi:hypothetical protein